MYCISGPLLCQNSPIDVTSGHVRAYDTIRRTCANKFLERSIRLGVIYDSFGPDHYNAEDMGRHLQGTWEPVWFHDIEADVTEAIELIGGFAMAQT